jgi:hypothetical protein
MAAHETVEPIYEEGSHGDVKSSHPAFGAISATRVSGRANLFDSSMAHHGYVVVEISGATMHESGYATRVHGGNKAIISVAMTEAQWVGFVSRMNMGSGTPCTIQRLHGEFVPGIPNPESTMKRFERRAADISDRNETDTARLFEQLRAFGENISSKKKREEFEHLLRIMNGRIEGNTKFARQVLNEEAEKVVVAAKVEIDATVQGMLTQLGLTSMQELVQLQRLAAPEPKDDES